MSKGTRFVSVVLPLVALYLLALFHLVPVPILSTEHADQILPVLPFWLLVSFGAYSLTSLGLGLISFRDCPEAYESLLKEVRRLTRKDWAGWADEKITQAKNELRDQGVDVD